MPTRRSVLKFLGLSGIVTTATSVTAAPTTHFAGLVVVYINVDRIPAPQAEAYVEKLKRLMATHINAALPPGWSSIFFPIRNGTSRVEVLFPSEQGPVAAEKIVATLKND